MESKWYEGLFEMSADERQRAIKLLDALRPLLPQGKHEAVDRIKKLLARNDINCQTVEEFLKGSRENRES